MVGGKGGGVFYLPFFQHPPPISQPADSYGLRWLRIGLHRTVPGQFDPQGEAYVLCCVKVITTVFFYISHTGLAKSLPLGKVGRPKAGSDEGVRQGFHGAW